MRLFLRYAGILFRSQMQHKFSFAMTFLGMFLITFTGFLSVVFMFQRFHGVAGFTFSEVLLCYGVVMASFSLTECFVRGFYAFRGVISNGEFDRMMVRPRSLMLQVLGSRMEFSRVGRLLQGLVVLGYAVSISEVVWLPDKILTLCLMFSGGVAMFAGIFILSAGACFFIIDGIEVANIFTVGAERFGEYPLVIYGEGVLKFLTYVLPMALFQYYPLLYLLGRTTDRRYMLLPLICFLFVIPCVLFWRFGVRHFKSTGS